jgi:hypothetical protein
MDRIVIVNRSTVLSDAEVEAVVPALQAQVHEDFAPLWGIDAEIVFGPASTDPAKTWLLEILDHTDVEGAGGYHVDENGRVSGEVFAADAIAAGEAWTVDASHELLEMLADPTAGTDPGRFVDLIGRYAGLQCLREVCDAVESDALGYDRAGADGAPVLLSDFVLPRYFGQENPPAAGMRADFGGHLPLGAVAPTLLSGGYLGIYDPATGQWSQVSDFVAGRRSRRAMRHGRTAWAAAHIFGGPR